ncbi:putative non-specific serine/threonine protein kinase [Medicago truncatula]|uniref:Leucine-rich receptor-like kinase family protein n=1 Tax=Medicago truncatula TaxID=3880 RepID=A0A072TQ57_MEDTR|nr:receptor-like protein EIX2 [Medicago truncatula]KEH15705.1 leucine-rich receptor-like kinase family protein [Medicago truncatula]RHN75104.1 putative non-specific serine/threonine protein kinase [Medicago truncatula]
MTILTTQISFLLLLLLYVTTFHKITCTNHTVVRCNEKDRETLLTFKQDINDSLGGISTWSTEKDCCAWEGVYCDSITNKVTKLDMQFKKLEGEMNLCILELEFLSYLDLSYNDFDVIRVPITQHNITRSSKLVYLDLAPLIFDKTLHMDNLHWLSSLSSLKYLILSGIDLRKETNWLQAVSTLPSLLELQLSYCKLNNFMIKPSIEYFNLSSLVTLYLSGNNFTSNLPNGFFNLTKDITSLDLAQNNIYGEIPSSMLNLQNLRHLDLSENQLQGSVSHGIGQLANIQHLDLSINMLGGFIPVTLGNLSSLHSLSTGSNNFSGEISNLTFSKLSSLDELYLSNSNIVFRFDLDWVPPFRLHALSLANTNQGPNFSAWIYTQTSLQDLYLSSSGISLVDRNKFSSLIESVSNELNLSNNSIAEDISNLTLNCFFLRLDHNNFKGGLPNISSMALIVDLSYNSFSGSIPHSWKNLLELTYIILWSNKLSGEVLGHLSDWKQLQFMNLEENEFSGTIPINMPQYLEVVILRANQFEGTIPSQLFNLSYLFHLDLAHNKLSGSMPNCIYNLSQMVTLYVDALPSDTTIELFQKGQDYMYEVRPDRRTIDLSVNSLSGKVSMELFRLVQVQTLNLSHNHFTGTIPKMIGGMKNMESLDLSNNKFCGEIPQSMSHLNFLGYLNLSCNNFNGTIPMGTQLQSFNASSYIANPELCGTPLKNCTTEENPITAKPYTENEDDDSAKESLYLGMGIGFAVGFWGIFGSLFLITKWRHAYYRFIDRVGDKLYVTSIVKLNNFDRLWSG